MAPFQKLCKRTLDIFLSPSSNHNREGSWHWEVVSVYVIRKSTTTLQGEKPALHSSALMVILVLLLLLQCWSLEPLFREGCSSHTILVATWALWAEQSLVLHALSSLWRCSESPYDWSMSPALRWNGIWDPYPKWEWPGLWWKASEQWMLELPLNRSQPSPGFISRESTVILK